MLSDNVCKVGSAVIHSNQIEAGQGVCNKLLDGPTHLTAGCQSGKTGVVIYAVNQFLNGIFEIDNKKPLRDRDKDEDFNDKMKKTQVIWINACSDNYLRDQTEKRLTEAFGENKILTKDSISKKKSFIGYDDENENKGQLIGKVYIGHLCNLQIDNNDNLVQLKKVIDFNEPILLILDESHVGQDKFSRKIEVGKDGKITEYNVGVLDNFCKNLLGIYLTLPKDQWDKRRYFLSMSATRPSWSVYINEYRKFFGNNYTPNIVHLNPGNNYCGIAKDYDNVTVDRFVQSEPFYDKVTKRVSNQIIEEMISLPFGKCIIIRCLLKDSDEMINSLIKMGFKDGKNNYAYVKCGIHHNTAASLNKYLTQRSFMKETKTVFFIERFLGVGATFPNVRIHAQFEKHSKATEAGHIQSVGRSFGYSDQYTDEDGNVKIFNKKDAKYKIYCDLDTMKSYKNGFNTDEPMYNDTAIKNATKRNSNEYIWVVDTINVVKNENMGTTLQNYLKNKFADNKDFDIFFDKKSVRMAYTKTTTYLDICKLIIDKKYADKDEQQSIAGKVVCIDGANSYHNDDKNQFIGYLNSHDELMDNIKNNTSWLCNYNISIDTFKNHYVCVYVYKKTTTTVHKKMKRNKMLNIT